MQNIVNKDNLIVLKHHMQNLHADRPSSPKQFRHQVRSIEYDMYYSWADFEDALQLTSSTNALADIKEDIKGELAYDGVDYGGIMDEASQGQAIIDTARSIDLDEDGFYFDSNQVFDSEEQVLTNQNIIDRIQNRIDELDQANVD